MNFTHPVFTTSINWLAKSTLSRSRRLPRALVGGALLFAFAAPVFAELDVAPFTSHDEASTKRLEYEPWAKFLNAYVRADADGLHRVDYAAVSDLERKRLTAYLETLQAIDVATLKREEQFAYWINLYNVATVEVVLEHHPVKSIRDIALPPAGEQGGPWDAPRLKVMGQEMSLNDIEHRILRPLWNDPRIHFAVNCASVGCPNLAAVPYTGQRIDGLLDRAAASFINHPRAVKFDGERLILSSLFDWYGGDFGDDQVEILEHLAEFAHEPLSTRLQAHEGTVEYAYDWDLNGF